MDIDQIPERSDKYFFLQYDQFFVQLVIFPNIITVKLSNNAFILNTS